MPYNHSIKSPITSGTLYTGRADGMFSLNEQVILKASNSWAAPIRAPGAPNIGIITSGSTQVTVSFTAPSTLNGETITSFTVTSSGGQSATGSASPITVTGLTNGATYTFTVVANSASGASVASAVVSGGPIVPKSLWSWGSNWFGQLGVGDKVDRSTPIQVGSLTDWSAISVGSSAVSALKMDGSIWTWGNAAEGQSGLNNVTYYSSPKQVGALTNWSKISHGYQTVHAIKTDNSLWAWGRNYYGRLGLGDQANRSSPVQVGVWTNWLIVSGGYRFTAGVRTDGTLWTWGYNGQGQLGLGNTTDYWSPTRVGFGATWANVSAGYSHVLAVKADGTLWAWGDNSAGVLGLSNAQPSFSSPMQVGLLTNWLKVSAGGNLSAAIKTDGTLWTWGNNWAGGLGLGDFNDRTSPCQVGGLTTWDTVSCGENSWLGATRTNQAVFMCGLNSNGQLGDGTQTNRTTLVYAGLGVAVSAMTATTVVLRAS